MNPKQLVITLNDDGTVSITGPIQDPIFCYGLMEQAKVLIASANPARPTETRAPGNIELVIPTAHLQMRGN